MSFHVILTLFDALRGICSMILAFFWVSLNNRLLTEDTKPSDKNTVCPTKDKNDVQAVP